MIRCCCCEFLSDVVVPFAAQSAAQKLVIIALKAPVPHGKSSLQLLALQENGAQEHFLRNELYP